MELNEILINEMCFQGITILNDLRETFLIDFLDPNIKFLNTKYFVSATLIYSSEWEKRKYAEELSNCVVTKFDLFKFLKFLCSKEKNKKGEILDLRDLMIKILLTFLCKCFLIF